jgi:4-amino-4-deoxy-L-arabinose transferase-like glycosyltransferase
MVEAVGDDRSQPHFALWLGIIAVGALAIRIAFVLIVDPTVPPIGDASAYHLLAEQLARGDGYIRPFDQLLLGEVRPTAEYPPLFPLLLAIPARLGIHSVESQRIFLAFVGMGTVALVGLLGRRVAGALTGIVAAAIAACSPMLLQSEAVLMAEALYVPLVVVMLLATYWVREQPSTARFATLGAVVALTTLTRAEGLLLGLLLIAGLCIAVDLPARDRVVRGAVGIGVVVLALAPWTIRNAVRFDALVPVSNNSATLVDGANCDATYDGPFLGLWRETFSQFGDAARERPQAEACFEGFDIADPAFDEADVAGTHRSNGVRYAREHLSSLPQVMAVRALRTWGLYAPRQQVNFEAFEGRPREWQMRGTILHWILLPLAVAGYVVLRRRRVPAWPLLTTAVTVTIVSAFTYGQQRFRVGAEPAICVLAAVAAVAAWRRRIRPPVDASVPRSASQSAG